MSKVNKSKSNAISMLFTDLEVTTEEVNKKQFIMFGEENGMDQSLLTMSFCSNEFLTTM